MEHNKNNTPTILVVFGATGDLMRKKIIPALFHLFEKGELPKFFRIVGFARRVITDAEFRKSIKEILREHENIKGTNEEIIESFIGLFSYHTGVFDDISDYRSLLKTLEKIDGVWGVCANKLFYLAASPQFYEFIFKHLASSGLTKPCGSEEGWTRVIVEKPFGKDLETANALEKLLSKLFQEIQIYRIDHYLAKEMLQNILTFRFSNNLFEQSWNNNFIEKIEIRLWEKLGVEQRGSFYDGIGALRDVGQNHLLQMLALATMEHPVNFSAGSIRSRREEILKTLISPRGEELTKTSFRAQYDGYRKIPGVAKDSKTETYFKTRAYLSAPKWRGVPIILESGKRLKEQRKEIVIIFRHPTPCLCPHGQEHYKNKVIIRLEPKEQIIVQFWSKKPGFAFEIEERDFTFLLREADTRTQYTEEYEKLLLDCIAGNQTLFVSSAEVQAMWRFIDPIIRLWHANAVPLKLYKPDTDEPMRASRYIEEPGVFVAASLKKEIGFVGLGKMGGNLARRLMENGWKVHGFNKASEATKGLERDGLSGSYSLKELAEKLPRPRTLWLMVPHKAVDEVIFDKDGLIHFLDKGDIVVDGGNSFYKDSIVRYKQLKKKGIHFMDAGVSGGPKGALEGASIMVGGDKDIFEKLKPLFSDLAVKDGYQFFDGAGMGHFVKMVHNGIEYGMMQSLAEGFAVMKNYSSNLDLKRVADVYNHRSVIESRLVGWLKDAFDKYGKDLGGVSGSVSHTGEGEWTVKTAEELKVQTAVIKNSLDFRVASAKKPSYAGKILSALREQFGGHNAHK